MYRNPRSRLFQAAVILAAFLPGVSPASAASAVAIVKNQNLSFGKIVGGSAHSGTVTVSATGVRSSTGTIVPIGTAYTPARFTITGNAGKSYTLSYPSSFTIGAGSAQMTVTGVTISIPDTGSIPAGGSLPFNLGGTLTVGSSQQNSTYSGSLTVTAR